MFCIVHERKDARVIPEFMYNPELHY
jgi:hypothetical protein